MTYRLPILFCTQCGASVKQIKLDTEDRIRAVCIKCHFVHYQNARNVTFTLATNAKGEILLAKRDIEPQRHLWTLPGGFMELFESANDSAKREMEEETHCEIGMNQLLAVISVPYIAQVHLMYHATVIKFDCRPTPESELVQMFAPEDIPWSEIAFHTVSHMLRHYINAPNTLLVSTMNREREFTSFETTS